MKIIKFRLWDKKHESFVNEPYHAISLLGTIQVEGHTSVEPDRYVIQQFTGLLDKNGKEIWEGDIVLINHPYDRTGNFTNAHGEVFWWDEEAGWYHGNESGRPPKRMWEYVEVVGNIYENPDLLKEETNEKQVEEE